MYAYVDVYTYLPLYKYRHESTAGNLLTWSLPVEEVVHLVEAEEDLPGVADQKDDDDADEHERDAAVPTTPESSNAYPYSSQSHPGVVELKGGWSLGSVNYEKTFALSCVPENAIYFTSQ